MPHPVDVYCADIGSIVGNNFGWFASHENDVSSSGTDIAALAKAVAHSLNTGKRVALGFEAPMFSPLRSDTLTLTKPRIGETNPNWIGGPGSAVLATALAQVPWILKEIKIQLLTARTATLDWALFEDKREADLFLWEAFVSGKAKGLTHVEDAEIAVRAFHRAQPDPRLHNAISEPDVLSLLGAALIRTGWSTDISLLCQPCLVIRA